MRSVKALAITFVLLLAVGAGLVGYATSLARQPHLEEYLAVEDKPYIEAAEGAVEEAEVQEEEEYVKYYHVPSSYRDSSLDGLSDQEYIAFRESGGDYDARNGQYVGKYQLQEDMLAGDHSPENQEYMAEQYMLDRYGSWEAAREFWDANGWW
jgi:hypothetical protein